MRILLNILLCFSLLLVHTHVQAQSDIQKENMINDALLIVLEKDKEFYERITIKNKELKNIHLRTDTYPKYFSFSKKIKDMNLKFINLSNYFEYKEIKDEIRVLFFDKAVLEDSLFVVRFSVRYVHFENDNNTNIIHLAISEVFNVIYKYSCEKDEWIYINYTESGV